MHYRSLFFNIPFLTGKRACKCIYHYINPLQTKRRPLYLKTQSLPRCKHFSSRL